MRHNIKQKIAEECFEAIREVILKQNEINFEFIEWQAMIRINHEDFFEFDK